MKQTILIVFLITAVGSLGRAQTYVDAEIFRFSSAVHFTPTLKVDSLGNIFLSGEMGNDNYTSGQEFGSFEFYNTNTHDGYVLKLNPDLDVQWVRPIVGVGLNGELPDNRVDDIIPWGNGGVLVKPSNLSLIEGLDTLYSLGTAPLLELSETGSLIAAHFAPFGNNGDLEPIGGDTVLIQSGRLTKYSFSEGALWEFPISSSSNKSFHDLAMGANGSSYLVGRYDEGELELNGSVLPFSLNVRGFVAKVEADGTLAWLRGIDSPESNLLYVEYDKTSDQVFVGGGFAEWVLDENQNVIQSSGYGDMLLATYDSDGNLLKIITGGDDCQSCSINSDWIRGMKSDDSGNLFALVDFGAPSQLGGVGIDGGNLLIKFGSDLEPIWIKDLNMSFGTRGLVGVDPTTQDIIVTGRVPNYQEVHLDGIVIPPGSDESNIVVARIKEDSSTTYVTGRVFIDSNSNGIFDEEEPGVPNQPVSLNGQVVYTGQLGSYAFTVPEGSHLIQASQSSNYWATVPTTYGLNTDTIGNYQSGFDFAVSPVDSIQDLQVSVSTTLPPRPGFEYNYYVTVKNVGTNVSAGQLAISLDQGIDTLSVWPSVTSGNLDTLLWNFGDLAPFQSTSLVVRTSISPLTNLGSSITSYFEAQTIGSEETSNDNSTLFEETVVGSYDPNDKLCDLEASESVEEIQAGLTYTIRFQNTGTYFAQDVRVVDTISPLIDPNSIETIGASHNMFMERLGENIVQWVFPSIFLPDSSTDFSGSQGFVTFSATPSQDFAIGEVIENSAAIYFDFNEPIYTNVVQTYVDLTSVDETRKEEVVKLWPNPAKDVLYLECLDMSKKPMEIILYDVLGKIVLRNVFDNQLDIAGLSNGLYTIQYSGKKESFRKVVINR